MKTVVVTDQNQKWFEIPDATILTARGYLAEPESGNEGAVRMLNLCRTGRYQGRGYYVSLLAEARGQRPIPDVKTLEDLRSDAFVRALDAEIQPLVQETLQHDENERSRLDVYFGTGATAVPLKGSLGGELGGLIDSRSGVLDPAEGDLGRIGVALSDTHVTYARY